MKTALRGGFLLSKISVDSQIHYGNMLPIETKEVNMTDKKVVKFTVEIECYEETIRSAVTQYQLRKMMGEGFNETTPQEKLGLQVALRYMQSMKDE